MTVSTILKFGPGVTPDPTKPLQDHLKKNLGRLSAPLNQKSLIQSVRIVHPGMDFTVNFLHRYHHCKRLGSRHPRSLTWFSISPKISF